MYDLVIKSNTKEASQKTNRAMESGCCLCDSRYNIDGFFDEFFLVNSLVDWPLTGHRSGHINGDVCHVGGGICLDFGYRFRDRRSESLHCSHLRFNRRYSAAHSLCKHRFYLHSRMSDVYSLLLIVGRGEYHSLMVDLKLSHIVGCRDKLRNLVLRENFHLRDDVRLTFSGCNGDIRGLNIHESDGK